MEARLSALEGKEREGGGSRTQPKSEEEGWVASKVEIRGWCDFAEKRDHGCTRADAEAVTAQIKEKAPPC